MLLVVANVIVFAWAQGALDAWLPGGRDPARLGRQVAPERLRVVPVERIDAANAANRLCYEVGPLDEAASERASAWARGQGERVRVEAERPVFRLRFASGLPDTEVGTALAQLAAAVDAQPRACPLPGPSR